MEKINQYTFNARDYTQVSNATKINIKNNFIATVLYSAVQLFSAVRLYKKEGK